MNERIRQLAEQAYLYQENDNFLTAALENFAELIVKECAIFAMVATDDHFDVDALYKHFGVEE
jgi:hypothetical protein